MRQRPCFDRAVIGALSLVGALAAFQEGRRLPQPPATSNPKASVLGWSSFLAAQSCPGHAQSSQWDGLLGRKGPQDWR